MLLEWAGEQPKEITTIAIDLEFLPTDTNEDRGVQNLVFALRQMHTALMALTSYGANDIVANSRKNPLEARRRLQKRNDPTTGGRKRNLLRTTISPGRCSLLELPAEIERWESLREEDGQVGRRDQACWPWVIGAGGVRETSDPQLESRPNIRGCALLEVVTYVEAKIGLRTRDSKPSDTLSRGNSDPVDVDAVNSLSSSKGKGSSSPRDGCFYNFQRDCNARKSTGKQSSGKGTQSTSWSKSEGKRQE